MTFKPLILDRPRNSLFPLKVGVLVSGNGSNLQALIDASKKPNSSFDIGLVISNVPNAFALQRAHNNQIPTKIIDHKNFDSRNTFEKELDKSFKEFNIELVVLAGFMRILSSLFLSLYQNKVINIHPALCPAFSGMHAAKQALDKGVWFTGCTVHLVNEGVDEGPIIAQSIVPIHHDDDECSLQKRIQAQEHQLLPEVISQIAKGNVLFDSQKVKFSRTNYR